MNGKSFRTISAAILYASIILVALFIAGCEAATPEAGTEAATPEAGTEAQTPVADEQRNATSGDSAQSGSTVDAVIAPTETPDESTSSGRVVLWHSWAGADGDALSAILSDLSDKYPDLIVDTLFVAYDDLPRTFADAVAAGGGPDLVVAPNWWLRDLVEAESVLPLDSLVAEAQLAEYYPAAVDNLSVDGQLYGLPVSVELVALYVNQGLIAPQAIPATTDEWLALIEKNPEAGVGLYTNLYHLYWGIPAFGGQLIDDEGVLVLDANNGAAEYLTWLQRMNATQGNFVDFDYGMLLDRFKKGEFPFFVDGPWAAPELSHVLGEELTVVILPDGPAGPSRPWLSADGLLVNPTLDMAQQQRALWLAQSLSDAEAATKWVTLASRLPANRNVDAGDDPLLAGFLAQAETAQSMPTLPEMDQVWGYGGDMLLKVLAGEADPAVVVAETTALINDANKK